MSGGRAVRWARRSADGRREAQPHRARAARRGPRGGACVIVRYSLSPGRPPGALKKLGYQVMWAAWWRSEPVPGSRPDAWGGARTHDEATDLVRAHASRFASGLELERLPSVFSRKARSVVRDQLPGNRGGPEQPRIGREQARFRDFTRARQTLPFEWSSPSSAAPPAVHPSLRALGLEANANEADVRAAFRVRARAAHPDSGGSERAFKTLNGHFQAALLVVRGATA
jgi:hypothetical protein